MEALIKKQKIHGRAFLCFLLVMFAPFISESTHAAKAEVLDESAVSQQNTGRIKGVVKDSKGEALIGVSVMIKGATIGTVTDLDGNYEIDAADSKQAQLVFSYIGYVAQTLSANKSVIDVVLKEDSQVMSEVVVVGYGTQKKENLTGAVASVDIGKTLESRPIADVGRGLQGSVPGLTVTIPSGEVGSDPSMRIRGQVASVSGSANPLILVDNVEIPSIQLVNPDDIESISVLKDAASTSIYGSKAAFGVVLITTKKGGKTENVSIQYSNNFSWQNIAKKIKMGGIDGLEYGLLASERVSTPPVGVFWKIDRLSFERSKEWAQKYGNLGANDEMVYGRDWYMQGTNKMGVRLYDPYDYMVREWAPSQTHNLSISGRSGKLGYGISLGYLGQSGMMKPAKEDDFTRYNASVKLNSEINKYVTVRAGLLYSNRNKRYAYASVPGAGQADPWYYLYRWSPVSPLGKTDGQYMRGPDSEVANANSANQEYNYTSVNIGATVNITKDWTIDADYTHANQDYIWNRPGTRFTALNAWGAPDLVRDSGGNQVYVNNDGQIVAAGTPGAMPSYQLVNTTYTPNGSGMDHIYRQTENFKQGTANVYSTYNLKLGDNKEHALKFMAGMNKVTVKTTNNWSQRTYLFDVNNPQFETANGMETASGDFKWESQLGYFSRINYAFSDKYLLEGNIRYDGSSKFPKDLKWRWFPSFSAGWRVTEESFMDGLDPILSTLKLRGSWGLIGDQTVPNGLYIPEISQIKGRTTWLQGLSKLPGYATPLEVDPYITWQDINTIDLGFDMRLFSDKLGVVFDWYQRTTQNMIVSGVALPHTFGGPSPKGNYGELRTRGWEIALDFNHKFSNGIGINATATLADATSIVTKYSAGALKSLSNDETIYFEGKRFGDIYGYKTDRLYQLDDFELDSNGKLIETTVNGKKMWKLKGDNPVYQSFLQNSSDFRFGPGDVKFVDVDGDGKIDNGRNLWDDKGDLEVIGNSTPRYEYSLRLGADYKGFDCSVFIQGVGKRDLWGDGPLAIPGYNIGDGAIPYTFANDFWKEDRTNAFYPRAYNNGASNKTNNMQYQSRYMLNMAYARIKNITLGYTLPAELLKKVYLSNARVYVALENFFTFDNLKGLPIDPETRPGYSVYNTETNNNLSRTGTGTPTFKTASFGLQLNF
ncbi:MAG: hypothetical protein RL662_2301 [Bacteroidota bacterium]|jgi:TonB-linked SusC/RagA family outer membrane protein